MEVLTYRRLHQIYVLIVVFLVNIRYIYSGINEDISFSIYITLLINILLLSCIQWNKVSYKFVLPFIASIFFIGLNISFNSIVDFFLLAYIVPELNKRKIIQINALFSIIFIAVIYILLHLGLIKDLSYYVPKSDSYVHSFGFKQANIFSLYVFALILSVYILYKRNILLDSFLLGISLIIYNYTGSRTCFIGVLVLLLVDILLLCKLKFLFNKFFLYTLPIILISGTFYFLYYYYNFPELDTFFSGRLSIMGSILNTISPFNWFIGFKIPEDMPSDSAYFTILRYGGIPLLLYYMYYYFKYIKSETSEKRLTVVISLLIAGMTEYTFIGLNTVSIILACIVSESLYIQKKK